MKVFRILTVLMITGVFVWPVNSFAAPKGKVVLAFAGSVKTYDPHRITGFPLNSHYPLVFDRLLFRDASGKIGPHIATSWRSVSPKVYEFKIRKGVKFTNGEDLDAHAVKYSLERIIDPKLKSRQYSHVRSIKNVEVVDRYTVRIHTKTPDTFLISVLSQYGSLVPPKYYSSKTLKHLARNPVGSGPYLLAKWKGKHEFHYEANPNYWKKGYPKIKSAKVMVVPEPTTRVSALAAGDVDMADAISPQLISLAKTNPKVEVISVPSSRTCYIYPIIKPGSPWEKVKVRQALNYAIDKEALVKTVLEGRGRIIATNVGPDSFGFNPKLKPYPYDPEKAKKLLAEAGYPNGFSNELLTPLGRYLKGKQVSEALVSMLSKVGIKVKLQVAEYGIIVTKMRARWKPKVSSFLRFACRMDSHLHSEHMYAGTIHSRSTWGGFREKWMDKIIDDARSEMDDAKRLKKYQEVNRVIHEKAILGFLYQQHQIAGRKKKLAWKTRADGYILLSEMELKPSN
jgi:peptide/nickel transport system substrate-binding protein